MIPALIATSPDVFADQIERFSPYFDVVHCDVMDGVFVSASSLDWDIHTQGIAYEVHLMVAQPSSWVQRYPDATRIYVHAECCDAAQAIDMIGDQAGIAIRPDTPLVDIADLLAKVSHVLLLTVEPGRYGSPFLAEPLSKITAIRSGYPNMHVSVDGGITPVTIKQVAASGAQEFVVGSFFRDGDVHERMEQLREALRGDQH